jgi:hypothetical protein
VDAYAQIAEAMPHFDRLESAFNDDPQFRMVLAMVYADIVEFHRRAYKFFRRRGEPVSYGLSAIDPKKRKYSMASIL